MFQQRDATLMTFHGEVWRRKKDVEETLSFCGVTKLEANETHWRAFLAPRVF